jgi:hypothetical protein
MGRNMISIISFQAKLQNNINTMWAGHTVRTEEKRKKSAYNVWVGKTVARKHQKELGVDYLLTYLLMELNPS